MKSDNRREKGKTETRESPWSKRLLYGALAGCLTVFVTWLVAVSTNHWVSWTFPSADDEFFLPETNTFLERQYAGMWHVCRRERKNETSEITDTCRRTRFFPSDQEIEQDPETDRTILNYRRAVPAVAVIGIFLTITADGFTWYAVQIQPRYIFKRLAGCLLIASAGCFLVCIETFQSMISYERDRLPARYPPKAEHRFGFSFGLAWVSFVLNVAASFVLLFYSRKKKETGSHDHPVIIGRV